MTIARLSLTTLEFRGPDMPIVSLNFAPGLNLVLGPSDTGKTCVFEAIDFMFGAKKALRVVPESASYNELALHLTLSGCPITLTRTFTGSSITVTEYESGRDRPPTHARKLSTKHSMDPKKSLSAYLLGALGITGAKVRKNETGELKAFSFRDLCRLALVDEERITTKASPIFTGQVITKTAEQNGFAFVLSGDDDRSIVALQNPELRTARRNAEDGVISTLLEEKRAELRDLGVDPSGLPDQIMRIEQSLEAATVVVATTQAEIAELERSRATLNHEHRVTQSRLMFVTEQAKRLRLLDVFYQTDHSRLQTVREASRAFHELPEGTCPLCNQAYASDAAISPHGEFEEACLQEMEKILTLRRDLAEALLDLQAQEGALQDQKLQLAKRLSEIDSAFQEVLLTRSRATQQQVQGLLLIRTELAQAAALVSSINGLEQRLSMLRESRDARADVPKFEKRFNSSLLEEFCQEVTAILKAWHYPELESVGFDPERLDITINGQHRANKGKGYRAITYAAFSVALLQFCRRKGLPHPGLVVLDTPVNPLKEVAPTSTDEVLPEAVKTAFFEHLANSLNGDQVLVLENQDPPLSICERAICHRFTKDSSVGRAGLFPPGVSLKSANARGKTK